VSAEAVRRFRRELRPLPHVAHALSWLCGPKAVASSSPLDRIRAGLEVAGLMRHFGLRLFLVSESPRASRRPICSATRRYGSGRCGRLHRD